MHGRISKPLVILLLATLLCATASRANGECKVVPRPLVLPVSSGSMYSLGPGVEASVVASPYNDIHDSFIMHVTIAAGASVPPHRHPGTEELVYVLSGEGESTIWEIGADEPVPGLFWANSTLLMPTGSIHDFKCTTECKIIVYATNPPFAMEVFEGWPTGSYNQLEDQAGVEVPFPPFVDCPHGLESDKEEL